MATETIVRVKTVSVTKAVAAAGNYAAEDVISENANAGQGTAWTFDALVSAAGRSGVITQAHIICETTGQVQPTTLYLFKATPTCELDDNAGNTAPLHADSANYAGKIEFPAMSDLGGDSEARVSTSTTGGLPIYFTCAATDDALFGVLVTTIAFTNETAGDDYIIRLTVEQE